MENKQPKIIAAFEEYVNKTFYERNKSEPDLNLYIYDANKERDAKNISIEETIINNLKDSSLNEAQTNEDDEKKKRAALFLAIKNELEGVFKNNKRFQLID